MNVFTRRHAQKRSAFTIVELLIVIVIIGILAAIIIVAYNGIQSRAKESQIKSDLANLDKAIRAARSTSGTALRYVTNSAASGSGCWGKPADTDLATLSKTADSCWTVYLSSLDKISTASSIDVRNLKDPWGRPYYLDENEDEPVGTCNNDSYGVYSRPFTNGQTMDKRYFSKGC